MAFDFMLPRPIDWDTSMLRASVSGYDTSCNWSVESSAFDNCRMPGYSDISSWVGSAIWYQSLPCAAAIAWCFIGHWATTRRFFLAKFLNALCGDSCLFSRSAYMFLMSVCSSGNKSVFSSIVSEAPMIIPMAVKNIWILTSSVRCERRASNACGNQSRRRDTFNAIMFFGSMSTGKTQMSFISKEWTTQSKFVGNCPSASPSTFSRQPTLRRELLCAFA